MLTFTISLLVILSTLFTVVLLLLPTQYNPNQKNVSRQGSKATVQVQVLVLGDIGRSPRMQFHALSIAKSGGQAQLIGYLDTEALPELRNHPNVNIIALPATPKVLQTSNRLLFLIFAPVKVLLQTWGLWYTLGYISRPSKWLLVQNPPSIPTLLIASVVCYLRQTRLVIDWHNFGYSILALKLGDTHPLVSISLKYEKLFANTAHAHFAVTDAMRNVLNERFIPDASIFTLHDRPAALYQPLSLASRQDFLSRHRLTTEFSSSVLDRRTRLVVSSTSWTPDEDFSVLIEALVQYSTRVATSGSRLPKLLVVITGKGPQYKHYQNLIDELTASGELRKVTIKTAWLSFADYAALLGSADLGVSLHTSSSGVDLPMKVVDMFGAGLPVLGYSKYAAWPELVQENVNGRGFVTAEQMGDIMEQLFEPGNEKLATIRTGALKESRRRWDDEWKPVAGRLFELEQ